VISKKSYANRSEAMGDLIRDSLVEEAREDDDCETVGTLTLVYDPGAHELADRLKAGRFWRWPTFCCMMSDSQDRRSH